MVKPLISHQVVSLLASQGTCVTGYGSQRTGTFDSCIYTKLQQIMVTQSEKSKRLDFFSDGGTWLYSTLASEQVQHLHRFGFFWDLNPLLILCDCRWDQTKPSISSVPGQQTEPEQHLRPTLRFHQHVFWTTSQGEVLHARSKDVWGYSEMRCQTKNQFVLFLTS